jgi:hypothetical protein
MSVVKLDDLTPDGVHIVVDWEAMVIGSSVFIPCVNTDKATQQVKTICIERKGWDIVAKTRVESSLLGVRVWRIL